MSAREVDGLVEDSLKMALKMIAAAAVLMAIGAGMMFGPGGMFIAIGAWVGLVGVLLGVCAFAEEGRK